MSVSDCDIDRQPQIALWQP